MTVNSPVRSSLVEQLTCPRCARHQGSAIEAEAFRALLVCSRRDCGQHFWAMWLLPGPIEPQLADVFGPELARENVTEWHLPHAITRPMLWELSLSRNQYEAHAKNGSRSMLRALIDLVRRTERPDALARTATKL